MDNLEKVEKIREKTGVTYEDAKNALEACEYDILDAIVYLEKLGKVKAPEVNSYSTSQKQPSAEFELAQASYEDSCKKGSIGEGVDKFFSWCGRVIRKGCDTTFNVDHAGKQIMAMPVIVFVLLLIFAFWVILPLLIIGMFCDCKYHFEGVGKVSVDLNDMCDKAAGACENIKRDIQNK